jgi:hypothetical protein
VKNVFHIVLKVLLTLLLLMPILGTFGVLPPPTRDLYNSDIAFRFIDILMQTGYINYIMAAVNFVAVIALWTRREALTALLIAPITVNIIGFHLFLDGGLFTPGAIMGNVLFLLNAYFLWKNWEQYQNLFRKRIDSTP